MDTKVCKCCGDALPLGCFSFTNGSYWSKCRKCSRPQQVLAGKISAERKFGPLYEAAASAGIAGYSYSYEHRISAGVTAKRIAFRRLKQPQRPHEVLSKKETTT